MDSFVIQGGRRVTGTVPISGSKNSALPLLAATLLADGVCVIENVPRIRDIKTMFAVLRTLGATVEVAGNTVTIDPRGANKTEAPYELVRTMRASVLVLAPLLAKWGEARVAMPGGCAIGSRPIDIHLKGLEDLGATVGTEAGYVVARAKGGLHCGKVAMRFASVGATEQLMMAAALARGTTIIENAAREPEITDLGNLLTAMGAPVDGAGSATVTIQGASRLAGVRHRVIADRIEAGTFLVAGAITDGDLFAKGAVAEDLEAFLQALDAMGVPVETSPEGIRVRGRGNAPRPASVRTEVHPGFPTDLQAQLMALACVTPGTSLFEETIFENRFMHAMEMIRMGANIVIEGRLARVEGVPRLSGAEVMASDLRASAALVLAGLVAKGKTFIRRIYHIDRGYEGIEIKLSNLGADIHRERDTANAF